MFGDARAARFERTARSPRLPRAQLDAIALAEAGEASPMKPTLHFGGETVDAEAFAARWQRWPPRRWTPAASASAACSR